MTTSGQAKKWLNLTFPCLTEDDQELYPMAVTSINAHECIVYASCTNGKPFKFSPALFKYNMDTNEMNEWMSHDGCTNMAFNNQEQMLYIHDDSNIVSINMKTNISNIVSGKHAKLMFCNYFLFINNCFHMINMHDFHMIGQIQNKSLNILHMHNTIDNVNNHQLGNGKAIYIPSKQCILLIGGFIYGGPLSNEVWIYKLTTKKWIKINNVIFERYDFGAVLTSNERYVVLLGGTIEKYNKHKETDEATDDIFVLDMKNDNNWTIKQCKIKCPQVGPFIATKAGGVDSKSEILTMGFVKECFKLQEFDDLQLPPIYIVSLFGKYYSGEMIHLMKKNTWSTGYYGIYLKEILSSMY